MKKIMLGLLLIICVTTISFAQLKSPDEFLGYTLGSKFTPHYKVVEYFNLVAAQQKNVQLTTYGKTYENRALIAAVLSDPKNMDRIAQIKQNNLNLANAKKNNIATENQPAILWLSYNVHGNEANSTETAMKVLYTLANPPTEEIKSWLKKTIVIIDPCLNPDGRDRYVNYFNSVVGTVPNPEPTSREHSEPWPGGRSNHYYFDLNRDWAWQTQLETQQRIKFYQQWMPQVHVDFHEQSYNEPYYFAPAAEPVHQDITKWQREFQVLIGKNNAKYFDENGWQYFTKERFDLLYPSYGDTYPLYNGAIGMTYEQGGIRAGLAVITLDGDTLTLKDRIEHHFTTSLATIETVANQSAKLVSEFKKYFEHSISNPPGNYKTYVVKAQNIGRLNKLTNLLKRNQIRFTFGNDKSLQGYNFETQKTETFKIERNDLIINLQQPRAVLASVLFEPQTIVTDSNTYDITAWALPYAYGLNAYGVKESINGLHENLELKKVITTPIAKPYAWVIPWKSIEDVKQVHALQKEGFKLRIADIGFTVSGKSFPSGTILIYRTENEKIKKDLSRTIQTIETQFQTSFYPIATGFVDKGKDFGSPSYKLLTMPKIGIVGGEEVSSIALGELWHFFEQDLAMPISIISTQHIANIDIHKINTLILPDGNYNEKIAQQLIPWLNAGGKLFLMDDAIGSFVGKKPFDIKQKAEIKKEAGVLTKLYENKDSDDLQNAIPGAIYKVFLDQSHPLSLNLGKYYYTLKLDHKIYEPLTNGWNFGSFRSNSFISGVVGDNVKKKLENGLIFGVQPLGKGQVIYLAAPILFRSFWENGKQLLVNGVFLLN